MNLTLAPSDASHATETAPVTHVIFRLGRELYSLSTATVEFITLMPMGANGGSVNLNGEAVDSLNVRARLGLPAKETAEIDALILVVTRKHGVAHRIALVVDEVEDVVTAGPIKEPTPYTLRMSPDSVAGTFSLGHKEVTVLDVETLLHPQPRHPSLAA